MTLTSVSWLSAPISVQVRTHISMVALCMGVMGILLLFPNPVQSFLTLMVWQHKYPPYNASASQRFSREKPGIFTPFAIQMSHWEQSKTERCSSVSPMLYRLVLSDIFYCYLGTWVKNIYIYFKNYQTDHLNKAHIHFCLSFTKLPNDCCLVKNTSQGPLVATAFPSHHH